MPWTQTTNWSTSPERPRAGMTQSRIAIPPTNSSAAATTRAIAGPRLGAPRARRSYGVTRSRRGTGPAAGGARLGGRGDPVALGEAAGHPADVGRAGRVSTD